MKPKKKKKKNLLTKIQKQNIKKISPRESLSTQLSRLLLHHYNGQYFILRYKVDVFFLLLRFVSYKYRVRQQMLL